MSLVRVSFDAAIGNSPIYAGTDQVGDRKQVTTLGAIRLVLDYPRARLVHENPIVKLQSGRDLANRWSTTRHPTRNFHSRRHVDLRGERGELRPLRCLLSA